MRGPAPSAALAASILAWSLALPATAQLKVTGAVFKADIHPDFPWTESAQGIQKWYQESYRAAGIVRISVANTGRSPLSVQALKVGEREYKPDRPLVGQPVVWWRLRPDPLPAGAHGVVEIRLRQPPSQPIPIALTTSSDQLLSTTVPVAPTDLRLGRISFLSLDAYAPAAQRTPSAAGTDIILWCQVSPDFRGQVSPALDGVPVREDQYITLGPWLGTLAIIVSPRRLLKYGTFHHFAIFSGSKMLDVAVVRARDDFVPLGTYGYITPREYAVNSLNLYVSFGRLSRPNLDSLWAYRIHAVTRTSGEGFNEAPSPDTRGHSAIWAYYLQDEPDCSDYREDRVPHAARIGSKAMEMVARDRNCYRAEPDKLTYLTIDQTYKPANWFVYGPIADVCATDHYPPPGKERDVFTTVETCRMACVPQMLVFIFRAWWPEPLNPKPDQPRGRMMFAGEERLHIGWALAAGAQGLVCYIHCTEKIGNSIFHGAGEFPDVWHAIGQMYRCVATAAPVICAAWPVDGAVSAPKGVFARALVAPIGMLVVAINEAGCKSTDDDFIVDPAEDVRLTITPPPWMARPAVAIVGEGELQPVQHVAREDSLVVTLPRLETCVLLLIAPPELRSALERRYRQVRLRQAAALLDGVQADLAARARTSDLFRRIPARYKQYLAYSRGRGAYAVRRGSPYWNPRGDKESAWEWYSPRKAGERWVRWQFTTDQAGDHYLLFVWNPMGSFPLHLTVRDSSGKQVLAARLPSGGEAMYAVRLNLPSPGQYEITLAAETTRGSAAQVSKAAYLVPRARATLLPPQVLSPGQ